MKEIWKDIKDFEGMYQISNFGRVKSLERDTEWNNTTRLIRERIRKTSQDGDGYFQVILCKNGKIKQKKIHRLMAEAFIKNPKKLTHVDHIDRNNKNNSLDNLRWVTLSENLRNSKRSEKKLSKYNGVYYRKDIKSIRWQCLIKVEGKTINLGFFHNEILAALKFDDYCIQNNLDRELNILNKEN